MLRDRNQSAGVVAHRVPICIGIVGDSPEITQIVMLGQIVILGLDPSIRGRTKIA